MAKTSTTSLILILSTFLILFLSTDAYARNLGTEETLFLHDVCKGKENVVTFDVYLHDLRVGNPNPTVFEVATASITSNSRTNFGSVHVVDDLLTVGPSMSSTAIGRIQGLTTSADLAVSGIALNLNIVFTAGRFNGSTISIVGRNPVVNAQRELAVAGGTGAFRFARGYAIQTTSSYDAASSYGVFKFAVYTTINSRLSKADSVDIAAM